MKLDKLLRYQSVDMELFNIKKEISENKDGIRLEALKKQFDDAKKSANEKAVICSGILERYRETLGLLNDGEKKMNALLSKSNTASAEQSEEVLAQLEALKNVFNELEKKAASLKRRAEDVIRDYAEALKGGKNLKEEYAKVKAAFEGFKKKYDVKLAELNEEKEKTGKEVDKELLAFYEQLAGENKMPAFVPAVGEGNTVACGACGMMLATSARDSLENNGYTRCETCKRIIYKA